MPRMTLATKAVLRVLLDGGELYGREIGALADLPSGTVTPILLRLVQEGWLESRREDIDPREAGRPVRNYYTLTEQGTKSARDALGGK
jgi:PadR family transcriptional regulator PadR